MGSIGRAIRSSAMKRIVSMTRTRTRKTKIWKMARKTACKTAMRPKNIARRKESPRKVARTRKTMKRTRKNRRPPMKRMSVRNAL